jgi:hypothetical protein
MVQFAHRQLERSHPHRILKTVLLSEVTSGDDAQPTGLERSSKKREIFSSVAGVVQLP